jgi:hypothetical protein
MKQDILDLVFGLAKKRCPVLVLNHILLMPVTANCTSCPLLTTRTKQLFLGLVHSINRDLESKAFITLRIPSDE